MSNLQDAEAYVAGDWWRLGTSTKASIGVVAATYSSVEMLSKGRRELPLFGSLGLLTLISIFGFSKNSAYLFPDGDGMTVLAMIGPLRSLYPVGLGLSANLIQGLGGMSPVNYGFEPSYNLGLLFFDTASTWTAEFQIFVNTVLSLEVFVATYVAALSFGFGRLVSLMAAWLAPFFIFPYFGFSIFHPLLVFAPHFATTISENLLILAAFAWLGRPLKNGTSPLWKDGLLAAAMTLMLVHMPIWSPLTPMLWLPVQGVLAVALLGMARSRQELRSKIMWASVAYLIWFAMFGAYIYSQFAYSATRYWATEFENAHAQWQFVSSWFRPLETAGKRVITVALVGLVLALADRRLRALAVSILTLMVVIFGGGTLMVQYDFWRGPAPVYFELFIAPFYMMFAAYAVARVGVLLRETVKRYRPAAASALHRLQVAGGAAAVGIIPASAIAGLLHVTEEPRVYGPALPSRPPLISWLEDKIAISPGAAFQGRVATFTSQNRSEAVGWMDIVLANMDRAIRVGNDYYGPGLWPLRIPTLLEYNQVMSPAFFRTAVELWGRRGDKQMRNIVVLRRPDATTLALFGVRFAISDAALPAPFHLEVTEQTSKSETLYLYEVPNVNLGSYSPTEIMKVATFQDALDAVSSPGFDGGRTAVVFDGDGDLKREMVPASDVQVRIDVGGLEISASSVGSSLLILPFEFSRCLEVTSNSAGVPSPAIFPVDGPLIGLVFTNRVNARIRYYTSPVTQPACRLRDAAEFSRLLRR